MAKIQWKSQDISKGKHLGTLDFAGNIFEVIDIGEKLVFGGPTNNTFLQSGYILRDEYESLDETLQELLSDLEVYYSDGPQAVSRIVCNERM